ncbi:MAG: hypothetical protein KZQ66_02510 [Candidatus Thiodiazotropha sp. (ex Lucinoma aequizonata)]|nr:hypothetical protein [Candidatus Thiodiazotropha sp. (ex Lucinoma aequizonata)]MCU7894894.1 hypothetical protein [Candidatus Thiodiazotropha sp. (ex Lucinoma aequizonata)]MCU7898158.1 hypothetical protein [Candidatus Thiodiazotropha sp. (ex Lucinoma aequizonata)]MCU7901014.1 hypothetical protein [Candidatus Thiodiazotropha sp. (ex Lucinoma aequizonata)]MCU7908728.1 hypothetical protein [Candidatus Thiodiazotropha sp. (ex Lucinoma aequizonata)]
MLHPKKVGTLSVKNSDEEKQTNEIKIAAPMLDGELLSNLVFMHLNQATT